MPPAWSSFPRTAPPFPGFYTLYTLMDEAFRVFNMFFLFPSLSAWLFPLLGMSLSFKNAGNTPSSPSALFLACPQSIQALSPLPHVLEMFIDGIPGLCVFFSPPQGGSSFPLVPNVYPPPPNPRARHRDWPTSGGLPFPTCVILLRSFRHSW